MSFLSPLFLIGAAAAALPVLVHLVRKTQAVHMAFPSLMFLRRIEQKTIRKRRLRNLLLMVLRCLAILLLALAFARPYYSKHVFDASAGDSRAVILIDGSYSMRYPRVFERAKQSASDIVNRASPSDQIAVALFSASCDVIRPLKVDRSEALSVVNQLEPGLGPTDYFQAVRAADSILKEAGKGRNKIYLISDFHQAGVDHSGPPFKLSEGIELTPIDVSDPAASNLVVSQVKADPVIYQQKYSGKVTATIGYSSAQAIPGQEEPPPAASTVAELKLNDLVVERRPVNLEPGTTQAIEFSGFNVPEGSNRATVEVSGDQLQIDNAYFFTIDREPQTKVLAIETPGRGRSESFFLQQVLLAGQNLPYSLTVKTPGTVSPSEVSGYRVVIVNDAAGITQDLAQALTNFVAGGGGLVLVAGKYSDPGEFNRVFGQISPAQVGDVVEMRGGSAFMSQINLDHPIFNPFTRSGHLAPTRVYAYRAVKPAERASVVAGLDDGHPLILESGSGGGKVLLFATSLDNSWSDLPLTPLFLPMVDQMLDYLSGASKEPGTIVGQSLTIPANRQGHLESVEDGAGKRIETGAKGPDGSVSALTGSIGFYRLKYDDHTDYVAVNLDTRESDLTKIDVNQFVQALSGGRKSEPTAAPDQQLTPEELESSERLWMPLLLLALATFAGEALLAGRIRMPRVIR
jgi:hypothetical protein